MPRSIPMGEVLDVTLTYVLKRQIQGRPTTVRQMSKRVSLGVATVRGILEKNLVQYVLIPVSDDRNTWRSTSTEIAIRGLPKELAERNGFTVEQVEESYERIFGGVEPEPIVDESMEEAAIEMTGDMVTISVLEADPYAPYRINTPQFLALRKDLIYYEDLIAEARKRGYPGRAVERAAGGDRMRYKLASPVWRPYIHRNKRYLLRDVLRHLDEVYLTYKNTRTGKRKRRSHEREAGKPVTMTLFTKKEMLGKTKKEKVR